MKKVLIAATMTLSCFAFAESYQAPDLKLKDVTPSSTAEAAHNWRSHYRVQETPAADRALASDEQWVDEETPVARDPSSTEDDPAYPQGIKPWRFYPESSPKD